jgi:hypothetical protein
LSFATLSLFRRPFCSRMKFIVEVKRVLGRGGVVQGPPYASAVACALATRGARGGSCWTGHVN